MKKLMTLIFALFVASCMQAPQTDLEGLKAMQDIWQSAFDSGDAAALAAIYTEDGALMPPNSDKVTGRTAIEAFWADFQVSDVGVEIQDTEVYAQGDDGYTVGTYTVSDVDGATIDEGKYVAIWRNVEGQWQIHRDIWNSNVSVRAPESQPEREPEPETENEAEVAD